MFILFRNDEHFTWYIICIHCIYGYRFDRQVMHFFFLLNASSHWKHLSLIIMQDERCDECWMYSTNEKSKISDASRWNCLFHFQMFYLMSCASRNNAFHIHVWYMNWAYNLQVSIDNNNICCKIKSNNRISEIRFVVTPIPNNKTLSYVQMHLIFELCTLNTSTLILRLNYED